MFKKSNTKSHVSQKWTIKPISKCKPEVCPYCTKKNPLCLSFGTHCPKNGVGLAQLLDQKFDFLNFFLASKFKHNPLSINVKKKIHYHIFKPAILMIFTKACTKTRAGYLKTRAGLQILCIKTWADCPSCGVVCLSYGTGLNWKCNLHLLKMQILPIGGYPKKSRRPHPKNEENITKNEET